MHGQGLGSGLPLAQGTAGGDGLADEHGHPAFARPAWGEEVTQVPLPQPPAQHGRGGGRCKCAIWLAVTEPMKRSVTPARRSAADSPSRTDAGTGSGSGMTRLRFGHGVTVAQ